LFPDAAEEAALEHALSLSFGDGDLLDDEATIATTVGYCAPPPPPAAAAAAAPAAAYAASGCTVVKTFAPCKHRIHEYCKSRSTVGWSLCLPCLLCLSD
jgi:hypothetical protein